MAQTIDIPGGTAIIRDRDEVKVRQRRLIEVASIAAASALSKLPQDEAALAAIPISELNLTTDEANSIFELQDATIVATLRDWTIDQPLPTLDTVQDLDPDLYEALSKGTSNVGAGIAAKVDFEPSDPKKPGFEDTPTEPLDASEPPSREDEESRSIEPQESTGTSTSTDNSST